MPHSVVCPEGHRVPLEAPPSDAEILCPECGSRCEPAAASDGAPRPRGLWGLMQPKSDPAPSADAPKGLWNLMGKPAADPAAPKPAATVSDPAPASPTVGAETESPPTSAPAAKGLWSLMGGVTQSPPATALPPPVPSKSAMPPPEFRAVELEELAAPAVATGTESPAESDLDDDLEIAPLEPMADDGTELEPVATTSAESLSLEPKITAVRSRGAVRSVMLGSVGVLASGAALLPELYAKIPGTLVGFLALMVGLLALGEIRKSRGRQRGRNWAVAGIGLGIVGMLLGPFVFSPLGGELRLRYGRRQTARNLERVGEALNDYYRKHDHFPPGGTFEQKQGGEDVPLHNWTTMLLPHLGENEAALYGKIDLKLPYNHKTNRGAMERDVSAFHASGASRTKTQLGFGVTHFVALGGTMDVENVGRVNVGIFSRNSKVKRADVTDGLEHTLVAGEIAFDFPAWGEPGQYRTIGKGLNASRDGFGNADRTGAMFLRADGSVKFLSNKIDADVLRKLSTRNGRETVERLSY